MVRAGGNRGKRLLHSCRERRLLYLPTRPMQTARLQLGKPRGRQMHQSGVERGRSYNPPVAGTIMVVEDEPAVARGVQVALEREGYTVDVRPTGEDAIANFADAAPDLVVLDVRLPGIDGFEVLRQLRRDTRAPVLFLA